MGKVRAYHLDRSAQQEQGIARKNLAPHVIALLMLPGIASATSFTPLGFLPHGNNSSVAWGVSADGTTVVGRGNSASGYEAFRWNSAEGMVGLGDLPGGGFQSEGLAISSDGSTVVGFGKSPPDQSVEGFRWSSGSGMVGLGKLSGDTQSSAWGVSADGSTVVGWSSRNNGSVYEAFRWNSTDGMFGLGGLPDAALTQALGVSADGSVVVGFANGPSSQTPFRWSAADGMVGLGHLPGGSYAGANDVSSDGSIIVGSGQTATGSEAFRWTQAGGMVGLGELAGGTEWSDAYAVSADGSVIVGSSADALGEQAVIWTAEGGMQRLLDVLVAGGVDLTGWTLTAAYDVSDDGRFIVGSGYDPDNHQAAFLAELTPVPIPAAAWLFGSASAGLGFLRRSASPRVTEPSEDTALRRPSPSNPHRYIPITANRLLSTAAISAGFKRGSGPFFRRRLSSVRGCSGMAWQLCRSRKSA